MLSSTSLTNSSFETNSSSSCLSDVKPELKTNQLFNINDQVKLIVDSSLFEKIQEESHGGWNRKMMEIIGKTLRVHRITEKGDVRIKFEQEQNIRWTIYKFLLNKINQNFEIGDYVYVNNDQRVVKYLLEKKWNENFKKLIGQIAKIIEVKSNGDLVLGIDDDQFSICKDLCYKIVDSNLEESCSAFNNMQDSSKEIIENFKNIGFENQKPTVEITEKTNLVDYFVKKCSSGNIKKVKELSEKLPSLLNERSFGKTGLQASCYQGHKEIAEFLLYSGSKIEKTDSDGDTALHYACFGNQPDIIEILLKYNACLNPLNKNSCSPLHVAVNKQFVNCVRVLVKHNCNVNIQDSYGDTPLHDVIGKKMTKESLEIIEILINSPGLNYYITNKRGFNLFHQSCLKGNSFVTENLLSKCPDMINLQKYDGYSALHLASLNGHKKIIEYLIRAKADLEMRTNRNQTALLLSIAKFNLPIIEVLVENYANVNAYDEDMDTGLHLVLNEAVDKNSDKTLSPVKIKLTDLTKSLDSLNECEFILQAQDLMPLELKGNIRVVIAVYLIKNGANLYSKNKYNLTCLEFVKDDTIKKFLVDYYSSLHSNWNYSRFESSLKSNESERCKLCDEEPITVTFLPCNHKCVCFDCSIRIKKCIECHQVIEEKIDVNGTSLNFSKTEVSELLEKVKTMEEAQLCAICMERKKDTTFQCGHTVCGVCSKLLNNCHICREKILTKIKIYEN